MATEPESEKHEEPDMGPGDDEILDAVRDRIAAEEKAIEDRDRDSRNPDQPGSRKLMIRRDLQD